MAKYKVGIKAQVNDINKVEDTRRREKKRLMAKGVEFSENDFCMMCGKHAPNGLDVEFNTSMVTIEPGTDNDKSQGYFRIGNDCAKNIGVI